MDRCCLFVLIWSLGSFPGRVGNKWCFCPSRYYSPNEQKKREEVNAWSFCNLSSSILQWGMCMLFFSVLCCYLVGNFVLNSSIAKNVTDVRHATTSINCLLSPIELSLYNKVTLTQSVTQAMFGRQRNNFIA